MYTIEKKTAWRKTDFPEKSLKIKIMVEGFGQGLDDLHKTKYFCYALKHVKRNLMLSTINMIKLYLPALKH